MDKSKFLWKILLSISATLFAEVFILGFAAFMKAGGMINDGGIYEVAILTSGIPFGVVVIISHYFIVRGVWK